MAELKVNPFAGYIFTKEEILRAATFNVEQRMYLQTLLSDAATEKINLEPMSHNMGQYLQKEAHLRGQLDILTYLLDAEPVQSIDGKSPVSDQAIKNESKGIDWSVWNQPVPSKSNPQS